ncbi:MAG: purine/pyrimidine permease [Tannerellaceae bacterium]|nr:purine/pyrimidine permease [Tannerellaceae bacterium]
MKYKLDDKPTLKDMLLYGVQWFTITLPFLIILSGVVSGLHTEDVMLQTIYSQKLFMLTGLALIIQVWLGHRLPVLTGPATVLLIGLVGSSNLSVNAVYTAIVLGGAMTMLLSLGTFFEYIQKIFTTRVVAVVLILVAITIMPLAISLSSGTNGSVFFNLIFALCLTLLMIFGNLVLKGIYKSQIILLGLILGTAIYLTLFGTPVHPSVSGLNAEIIKENLFISPEFDLSAIIAFFFCFLALIVNEFGAIQATATFIHADSIAGRSRRGLRVAGIFNMLSGSLGTIGMVDYSMSPGIIAATQSASRFPLIVAGVLLIISAFFPQSLFLFSYIPGVVLGSVLLYVMSTQLASGLQLIGAEKSISDFRSAIIIGFPVMTGIFISFAPPAFAGSMPGVLQPIAGNGFIMGSLMVLVLEHLLEEKSCQE